MNLRKNLGRVASTIVATALLASVATVPAFAADYTAVKGGTMTFDKYLVMDVDANVPTADFAFAIGAGTAVSATDSAPEIKAPSQEQVGAVKVQKDGFAPADQTYDQVQDGDTLTLGEGKKYAFDVVTVDFSNVAFSTPGVYRFTVTESGTVDGVTNDNTNIRYIDVYVLDDNGALIVDKYVFHESAEVAGSNGQFASDEKESGFTNTYATENVTLTKQVEGNMGDKSKDFAFTIEITSAGGVKSYTVEASDGTSYNPITTALNEDETACVGSATVNLSDDEYVTIKGLSAGDTYKITETKVDGYTTKYTTNNQNSDQAIVGNATDALKISDTKAVTFYNISNASTPTGIVMNVAPYALLVVVAVAGCFVFLRKRNED